MSYHFQKCCFDSEKAGVINECNRMSCILNGSMVRCICIALMAKVSIAQIEPS